MENYFEELVKTRQACRDFNDEPLEKETIEKIVDLARLAPSACNSQPWKMYCVTEGEKKQEVLKCLTDGARNGFLKKAQAFIVVAEKKRHLKKDVETRFSLDYFVKYDVGELIAYLTLSAKAYGVESIVIGWVNKDKLADVMSFEKGESCSLVVALGYSNSPLREKTRRDKDDVIKFV